MKKIHRGLVAVALLSVVLLVACANTNGLSTEASLKSASDYAAEKTLSGSAPALSVWPRNDWWTTYNDPQLNVLIEEALSESPTLRVAQARTRKALAFAATTQAALYPQVNGDFEVNRQRFPDHGLTPPPFNGISGTLYQLQATLDWELDVWGKNRAAYESAVDQTRAAEVDAYAARLALSVTIAQAYVQLDRAYLQLDVAQATLKEREQIYALTRERNAAGIDSRLELKQAEAALPATREQIEQLRETIGLTRNMLSALLGEGPDRGLAIARPVAEVLQPVGLPSSVPAELLGRRPDIIAQRWRVEAAQKDIAGAKAAFYPDVNLVGLIGLQSFGPAGFLSAASRMMGFGPAVTLPIFEGGRLRGNLAGTNADYDIAVEQYNQLLADALRDIVDQLTSLASVDAQHREQAQALADAQEAYDLALLRYRQGIGNYLQVLSAESPLLVQQGLEADLRARDLEISVGLVRALGGGFTAPVTPVAVAR
jgi:NodT family efflux transporter outer membrane factor (OMF) lipoprotein